MVIPIIPQNVDRAISARDYANMGTSILVTSWFPTIQGEGIYAGYPSMFVRLAGCNYGDKSAHCDFCDTSFQFHAGVGYEPRELLKILMDDPGYNNEQILVITGGEPTLQINLLTFILIARPYFKDIQLETNGTQPKFYEEAEVRGMLHNHAYFKSVVSPKANLKSGKYSPIPPAVLAAANCLKFVLSSDSDSPHFEVPDWAFKAHKKIYVSPMAVYNRAYSGEVSSIWDEGLINKDATAANYHYAAVYAMRHRLLLSVQTHLFIGMA